MSFNMKTHSLFYFPWFILIVWYIFRQVEICLLVYAVVCTCFITKRTCKVSFHIIKLNLCIYLYDPNLRHYYCMYHITVNIFIAKFSSTTLFLCIYYTVLSGSSLMRSVLLTNFCNIWAQQIPFLSVSSLLSHVSSPGSTLWNENTSSVQIRTINKRPVRDKCHISSCLSPCV